MKQACYFVISPARNFVQHQPITRFHKHHAALMQKTPGGNLAAGKICCNLGVPVQQLRVGRQLFLSVNQHDVVRGALTKLS